PVDNSPRVTGPEVARSHRGRGMAEVMPVVGLNMRLAVEGRGGLSPRGASRAETGPRTRVRWPGAGVRSGNGTPFASEHQFERMLRARHGAVAERADPHRARPGGTPHRIRGAGSALRGRRGAEDVRHGAGGPDLPGPGHQPRGSR